MLSEGHDGPIRPDAQKGMTCATHAVEGGCDVSMVETSLGKKVGWVEMGDGSF
jgi:hypothetical protein